MHGLPKQERLENHGWQEQLGQHQQTGREENASSKPISRGNEWSNIARLVTNVGKSDEQADAGNISELTWRPVRQHAHKSTNPNSCEGGKMLPQLYVLGAAKSATTSLAANLMAAGVESVGPDCRGWCDANGKVYTNVEKEFHFFDAKMDWFWHGARGESLHKELWKGMMPDCPRVEHGRSLRRVVGDFTPEYLRMTALPPGAIFADESIAHYRHLYGNGIKEADGSDANFHLPAVISHFHGHHAKQITFVVMLREPLSRLRSLYDCCICPRGKGGALVGRCKNTSFSDDLRKHVAALQSDPPQFSDWIWGAFYGLQIEEWISVFDAAQFYVIPMKIFTSGASHQVCKDLANRINFRMKCGPLKGKTLWLEQSTSIRNEPADKTISLEVKTALDSAIAEDSSRLVSALMKAYRGGAGLANFTGNVGFNEIERWLHMGW
eukprot:TRINITY_DN12808_c0_g2_i2.p1 TRINITY_DN12808_c0_g2~~TRINITY_DN12808_c0_g2_i2.p1  ORF type:complete len:438 (+),score=48.16 TRINITY_DN12808_c0_g2_i2:271-1584(+)